MRVDSAPMGRLLVPPLGSPRSREGETERGQYPSSSVRYSGRVAGRPLKRARLATEAKGGLGALLPGRARHARRDRVKSTGSKFGRGRPAPFQTVPKRGGLSGFPRS